MHNVVQLFIMQALCIELCIICFILLPVVDGRGMSHAIAQAQAAQSAQSAQATSINQMESNLGWSAPAGAAVSAAAKIRNAGIPPSQPEKTVIFNGCVHGVCDSSVYATNPAPAAPAAAAAPASFKAPIFAPVDPFPVKPISAPIFSTPIYTPPPFPTFKVPAYEPIKISSPPSPSFDGDYYKNMRNKMHFHP